jgi:hypothetical protein
MANGPLNSGPRKKGRQVRKRPAITKEDKDLAKPAEGVAVASEKEQRPEKEELQTMAKEYVVSVDATTGSIVKIEKLDEKTQERKEFTENEYAAAYAFGSSAAPYYAAYAACLYDPWSSPAVQNYLKSKGYIKASIVKR